MCMYVKTKMEKPKNKNMLNKYIFILMFNKHKHNKIQSNIYLKYFYVFQIN